MILCLFMKYFILNSLCFISLLFHTCAH